MTRENLVPLFNDLLDELGRGFLVRPLQAATQAMPQLQLRMDVKESENQYVVHADMPGVKKEDIHVTVDKDTVSIEAESKEVTEKKEGEKVLATERYYGKVSRTFRLGNLIDESAVKASFTDGVLELVLPKRVPETAKKVNID